MIGTRAVIRVCDIREPVAVTRMSVRRIVGIGQLRFQLIVV